ncbi:MAG: class I SAM-dependent methyltransferase [Bacteroidota bacterium]
MNCPLCQTPLVDKIDPEYFDCGKCRALVKDRAFYVNTDEELKVYKKHDNDVEDPRYQNFTSPIWKFILEHHQPGEKALDFGCGTGPVITHVLRKHGYENINLYDPFFYPEKAVLDQQYDYIFSCEVVEHFAAPREEYEKLLNKIKRGGRLLLMTHPYDGKIPLPKWYYRRDPTHIFIHRKATFEYIADLFDVTLEHQGKRLTVLKKM